MPLVRRASAADAGSIAELYRTLVKDPRIRVLPEHIHALADDRANHLLVSQIAGIVCGTALVSLCADVMYGRQPFAIVENVVVDERSRGQGIGTRLMAHIDQLAREHDCSKIMLLSAMTRDEAHRFFEACGYQGDRKRGFVRYRSQFDRAPG